MEPQSIATLLQTATEMIGRKVRIQGWVRTRRDSKAGLSFIQLSDGSCFATMQVVAPSDLPNYESDVLRLTSGAAVIVEGEVVESRGKGQSIEVKADGVEVTGFVDDPDTYPVSPKKHSYEYLREVCLLYTSPSPRDRTRSRMPSSA